MTFPVFWLLPPFDVRRSVAAFDRGIVIDMLRWRLTGCDAPLNQRANIRASGLFREEVRGTLGAVRIAGAHALPTRLADGRELGSCPQRPNTIVERRVRVSLTTPLAGQLDCADRS